MTEEPRSEPGAGPTLLCAGTDASAAARLAEVAVPLLGGRPAVVLATWDPPPVTGGYDAVMDALYDTHADLRAVARAAAAEAADAACEVLEPHVPAVTKRVVPDGRGAWQVILDAADEVDAGVIVVGAVDRGGERAGTLGREARALAHRTRRPLLVLPAEATPARASAPALFAYDGSPPATNAVGVAAQLLRQRPAVVATAWMTAAQAVAVAMLAVPDEVARKGAEGLDTASRNAARASAHEGAQLLGERGWQCHSAQLQAARKASTAIIDAGDDPDAAVNVTGTRGRSRVAATLLGSTAEEILRHAERPVLLVPPVAQDGG
jgi:nucleotide-binding universal stress UspA family protein